MNVNMCVWQGVPQHYNECEHVCVAGGCCKMGYKVRREFKEFKVSRLAVIKDHS